MFPENRKGASLVEAVIAIALMGIMLVWAVNVYLHLSHGIVSSRDMEIASQLASGKVEYLKTLDETAIDSIATTSVIQFPAPYQRFGYEYIVPDYMPDGSPNPDIINGEYLKYIEVDVFLMSDTNVPLMREGCNFLRNNTSGENEGT